MFKILSITFLVTVLFHGNLVSSSPFLQNRLDTVVKYNNPDFKTSPSLLEHAKDFLDLINFEKVIVTVIPYLNDPEVQNFATFFLSDEFKKIVWDFESMAEFKEAVKLLTDKGYDVESVINLINLALQLPPIEKTDISEVFTERDVNMKGKGINGLIEDIIAVLPLEDMKALFENKVESNQDIAELFETINSPEFLDIMKRMFKNPQFIKIQETFAGYGFDFKYLCTLAKGILGEYYQGVFCEGL